MFHEPHEPTFLTIEESHSIEISVACAVPAKEMATKRHREELPYQRATAREKEEGDCEGGKQGGGPYILMSSLLGASACPSVYVLPSSKDIHILFLGFMFHTALDANNMLQTPIEAKAVSKPLSCSRDTCKREREIET